MKYLKNVSYFVVGCILLILSAELNAQTSMNSTENEIIALTYKIWKAENENDMATRNKYIADDYTEFNPVFSTRVDGKTKSFTLTDANSAGGKSLADEMLNPKVQVYGNTAILTYNFAGIIRSNDGKVVPSKAKSTRVYVKMDGDWKLVHANFAMDPNDD